MLTRLRASRPAAMLFCAGAAFAAHAPVPGEQPMKLMGAVRAMATVSRDLRGGSPA
jgi:hypothetical protein